ncbi:MAG: hypothetical protein MUC59_02800 [Saprospiraceae bacterium]|jgi:hypothetical protein|nr:hypothetical protein [Saprospiraceae bacterium]
MSDFDFYEQFGKKMRSLRPSDRTAGEDWQALSHRLDANLPTAQPLASRSWQLAAAALLLLLLVSNLWWGFTFREQDRTLANLTAQLTALNQKLDATQFPNSPISNNTPCGEVNDLREQVAALQAALREANAARRSFAAELPLMAAGRGLAQQKHIDSYPAISRNNGDYPTQNREQATQAVAPGFPTSSTESGAGVDAMPLSGIESKQQTSATATPEGLPTLGIALLENKFRLPFLLDNDLVMLPADDLPFTKKAANALLPKSFSIGASAGWLYPLEPDMEHQTGYGYGFQAAVGFSRKVSLTADWHRATLHYNALAPDAAIGLPTLPLPSPEHSFLQMEVSNQRLTFWGLGLRYKGLPQATWHPYGSIGWSGMKVSPFMAHYETEVAGSIYKGEHHTGQGSGVKNYARLGAGVAFPIGRRFDLSLEGYYLHAWRNGEPDLMGVRTGLNFNF